jgi:quercetin dioxygenase-like cupin family protein
MMNKRLALLAVVVVSAVSAAVAYAALPPTSVPPSSVPPGTLAGKTALNVLDPSAFAVGKNAVITRLHFDDNQSTGWHTHPGPNMVVIVSGGFKLIDANCHVSTYGPGQGFVTGLGVHEAIAIGATEFYSVYLLPDNADVLRTEAAPPSCALGNPNTIPSIVDDGQGEDTPAIPPGLPLLHVHISQHWFGYVRSSGSYLLDCPRACLRPIAAGSPVTLTATPNSGWAFDKWSGGPCDGQTTSTCTFTMPTDSNTDIIAAFKKKT